MAYINACYKDANMCELYNDYDDCYLKKHLTQVVYCVKFCINMFM